ncbi:NYN domain-containing protein [Patescibacteria group bacterium]|nr:NYN domain-containing protein [Patescibacteria group bacterium]
MTHKIKTTRYAFIDSQNLNLAIKDQGWDLDFGRFRRYLKEKYAVERAYLFIGLIPKNQPLYTYLQSVGFILIFKQTLTLPNGTVKGNVDAELVLHAMIEWPNYDEAVIVTGDGDFACLVQHLLKEKKLGRLLIPHVKKYSALLKAVATDRIDFMNGLQKKLQKHKEGQLHRDETP